MSLLPLMIIYNSHNNIFFFLVLYGSRNSTHHFVLSNNLNISKIKGIFTTNYHFPEHPKRWRDYSVEKHFPEHPKLAPPLLQLNEVSFSHPDRSDFKLSNVDVGIVRPNGDGKSTLLNLLEGDLLPTEVESAAESEVDDWKVLE